MQKFEMVDHLALIGVGLLGASVGLGLKRRGWAGRITGVGRTQATLDEAQRLGAIDASTRDLPGLLGEVDLVVVAAPLGAFEKVFEQIGQMDAATKQPIITDVGSTKSSVQRAADRWLREPGRFVGAHPMAGSEQQGPGAADSELFVGKPCIICPGDAADPEAVAVVQALFQGLGMSLLTMSPEQHDRQTAVTSHLPHLAAALLVQTAAQLGGWDVASTGFASTTRLASSNPPMRRDIILANREAILEALDQFATDVQALRTLVEQSDGDGILRMLEQARDRREQWMEGKNHEP